MYESISYAELKKLPAAEKPEAWKELKNLYSTQKELADKLGVSSAVVYNMIARYAGSEKKATKLEVVKTVRKRRAKKQPVAPEVIGVESESFSIAVKKDATGEDAQFLLNGIGSTLLKNQKYVIEIKVTEK